MDNSDSWLNVGEPAHFGYETQIPSHMTWMGEETKRDTLTHHQHFEMTFSEVSSNVKHNSPKHTSQCIHQPFRTPPSTQWFVVRRNEVSPVFKQAENNRRSKQAKKTRLSSRESAARSVHQQDSTCVCPGQHLCVSKNVCIVLCFSKNNCKHENVNF